MRKLIAGGLAGLMFVGALASAAEAADRRRHRDNDGAAVAAGIAGLAIGAALASGHRDRGYYRNGYYDRRDYGGYYGGGYYARPYRYAPPYAYYEPRPYRPRCRVTTQWDPYYGDYVRIRRCW